MDESLRRAYLDAMGIPIWVPRDHGAGDTAAAHPDLEVAPARPAKVSTGLSALRGLVDGARSSIESGHGDAGTEHSVAVAKKGRTNEGPAQAGPAQAGPGVTATSTGNPPLESPGVAAGSSWVFLCCGASLFIDQLPDSGRTVELSEFYRSLQQALGAAVDPEAAQEFSWPPKEGPALDRVSFADAVVGRAEAILSSSTALRVHLLGNSVTTTLQAAAARLFSDREVSHHPPASEIMHSAVAKRQLWAAIAPSRLGRHANARGR